MKRLLAAVLVAVACLTAQAHDFGTSITWNREISRLVFDRCASCHRQGGTSFSLMTYPEAQPRATEIKDAVLSRRMPPWGAVKGFGDFRNDQGLTQEQVELVAAWVEGGMRKGNNPKMLPEPPKTFADPASVHAPPGSMIATRELTLRQAFTLDGLVADNVRPGSTMQIVAVLPDGTVNPLLWLYEYSDKYRHPFLLRKPLTLPAGTVIRGVRPPARITLLPVGTGVPAE
jgi:hypothetical protein